MLLLPTGRERTQWVPVPDSPEGLIREARRRTRRRRLRVAVGIVLGLALATAGYALLSPVPADVIGVSATSPYANMRAFSGHGELAFVSRGQLWVLDGSTKTLRELRVPAGDEADFPTFSHDGHWLAYTVRPVDNDYDGPSELWIARADGTGAYRVLGVALRDLVGWSPRADLIAVTAGRNLRGVPYGQPRAVMLVAPHRSARTLLSAHTRSSVPAGVEATGYTALWSPSGSAIAVGLEGRADALIESVPIAGGRPTVWFERHGIARLTPMVGVGLPDSRGVTPQLAGWWSRWGIAFWVLPEGASDSRDSTPLVVIRRPGAEPRFIAGTLSQGMSEEIAPGPGDRLALVASTNNGGREFAVGKSVETCSPSDGHCTAVPAATIWSRRFRQTCPCFPPVAGPRRPGSGVSEDPSWSPDGTALAYVKAPAVDTSAWPSNAWFAQHQVYIWNSQTAATRHLGKVDGAALPVWSANGRDLMYESGDGLWLMPLAGGRPAEVVHPLYSQTAWNNRVSHLGMISYYGQIPWQSQFSWWSPSR